MAKVTLILVFVLALVNLYQSNPIEVDKNHGNSQQDEGELLLLQVLTRHGDRTPALSYPADPYATFDYPEGVGNLINLGKQKMYRFGKVLRKRYLNYIENTQTKNVLSQSSPSRRCLESEQALLTGLFPPRTPEIWSRSPSYPEGVLAQIWQPISIQTVEESRSWKLYPSAPCPKADQIDAQLPALLPELNQTLNENADFIQRVFQYSQFPPISWQMVGYIQDTTNVEREYFGNKFVLPPWYAQVGPDTEKRMNQFLDLNFRIYGQVPEYLKLRAGTFLNEAIGNFKAIAGQTITKKNRQLFTYSSHDLQVGFILHALGVYKERPTYGSGLIFELRKHRNIAEPQVHLLYANVTNNYQISKLKLNESPRFAQLCSKAYCSLTNFEASLVNFVETDVENDCKV